MQIGQDPTLLNSYNSLTSPSNGSPGMGNFPALVLMVGELADEFQTKAGDRASEYTVLIRSRTGSPVASFTTNSQN